MISSTHNYQTNLATLLRQEILPLVQKPAQYLGIEQGAAHKDWNSAKSRMAIIYPDLYELGMSNFGTKILYSIVNAHPDYLCDRAYAPMADMEAILRERNIPLWAWESTRALKDFDFIGFSLGYELCYTNVLNILDLAQIPLRSSERTIDHPLIFAGGPAVHNPEPMADFMDFYLIGDGEDLITEVQDCLVSWQSQDRSVIARQELPKQSTAQMDCFVADAPRNDEAVTRLAMTNDEEARNDRQELLLALAQIPGVYVPSLYVPDPEANYLPRVIASVTPVIASEAKQSTTQMNCFVANTPRNDIPVRVRKRIAQLDDRNQPTNSPVAHISTVQDKQVMEIRRGCDRGCRFCQVGYVYLPVRERSPEDLLRLSTEAIKNTGHDSYTMLSLSASDYTCLTETAKALNDNHAAAGVSMSMPSQRADRFNVDMAEEIQKVRKSGMTFAPEAGTERMRKVINKGLSQEDIYKAIKGSYEAGWSHIKLYFMIGLPTETDEDLDGILDILSWSVNMAESVRREERERAKLLKELGEDYKPKNYKQLNITCTISTFVPKTFTAFQYYGQCSQEEFKRKHKYLQDGIWARKIKRYIKLNCTDPEIALLEAVMSRGDRRWGAVIERVWRAGSRMDSWAENMNIERWSQAAKDCNLSLEAEAYRQRQPYEPNCWEVLDLGFTDKFFPDEWAKSLAAAETSACTENKCHACGVCFRLDTKNVVTYDRSDSNPFVTEIDIEKRKRSCASLGRDVVIASETSHCEPEGHSVIARSVSDEAIHLRSGLLSFARNDNTATYKYRLVITKLGDLKFIGNLDFQRLFERALRKTGLPLVHSQGFNQRIKISWGAALGLFIESEWEYIELELAKSFENLEDLRNILNQELPEQAKIKLVEEVKPDGSSINKVLELSYTAKLISRDRLPASLDLTDKLDSQSIAQIVEMKILAADQISLRVKPQIKVAKILSALIPEAKWQLTKTKQTLQEPALVA